MKIQKIITSTKFGNINKNREKREFIDVITDSVRNPRDIQDCVVVPRGIFKSYIYLMSGSSMMLMAAALPQKMKNTKAILNIFSAILSGISAVYFAKPFAVNGLSPTVNKNEFKQSA